MGVNDKALNTTEDVDNIVAFDWAGLGTLLRDSYHSFFPQDIVPHLYSLLVFAGLQVLVVLVSCNQIALSGVTPGDIPNTAEVRQMVISVRGPF